MKRCRIHIGDHVLGEIQGPLDEWSWVFTWLSSEGPRKILMHVLPDGDPGMAAIVSVVALQRQRS